MACVRLPATFLVVHSYSVEEDGDFGVGLADGPAAVARVCTVAVVLVVEVALVGFEQLVHSEVVLDAVLLVVVDFAYCLAQEPWTILELMCHRTTSETCSRYYTTLSILMIFATMNANQWVLSVLILPRSLVLLVLLLVSLCLSINLEDLVVQVLKLVSSSDGLFKCSKWHNSRGIPLYDRVKSLKELSYLLLHSVDQVWSVFGQPFELGEVLKNSHISLHKLLELYGLLPLDMCRHIFVTELFL